MIIQTFEYRCAACARKETQQWQTGIGFEPTRPYPPSGWLNVPEVGLFCPAHKVSVHIDDRTEIVLSEGEKVTSAAGGQKGE